MRASQTLMLAATTANRTVAARARSLLPRAVELLTGIDEAAEPSTLAASAALQGTLAIAAAGIASILVIDFADHPGNRLVLGALLACVLSGAALAAGGAQWGYKTVSATAVLSAIAGWPLLALCVALQPEPAGRAVVPAMAIAFIVTFALSALLRPVIAACFLALALGSVAGWSGLPQTEAVNLIGLVGAAFAGLFGLSGRIAIERLVESRRQVGQLMQRLAVADTLEATAQSIATQIADATGFELVLVAGFLPDGTVRHLAHASALPNPIPLEPGRALRPNRAVYLLCKADDDPWLCDWEPTEDVTDFTSQMHQAGLRTSLYVPIRHEGNAIGVLAVGCGVRTTGMRLRRRGLLEHWRPAMVEAASLVGSLLAPQIAQFDDTAAQASAIRAIIDQRGFLPVYQPIVELHSGSIVGYEALTRFVEGERPDVMFETAERVGVGQELERATLEAAVTGSAGLPAGAYLSVNVSPEFLLSGEPAQILRRLGRPLSVELTEHVRIDDYEAIRGAMSMLGREIRLAVDDAGAGFASLRHVLELRPDTVKLDLALVRSIDADPARQALVAGMVHFADLAKFALVAEGVETQEERETLISLGVVYGQGYLFGRPKPVESWPDRVAASSGEAGEAAA